MRDLSPLLLVVALGGACSACGGTETSTAAGAAAEAGSGGDARSAAGRGGSSGQQEGGGAGGSAGAGGAPCELPPRPPQVPEGWVDWTDFSCESPLYVPAVPEQLPAPLEWGPCRMELPGGIACQTTVSDRERGVNLVGVEHREGKPPLLGYSVETHTVPTLDMANIEEVGGKVLFSAAKTRPFGQLSLKLAGLDGGLLGIALLEGDPNANPDEPPTLQGLVLGSVQRLEPRLFVKERTTSHYTWQTSSALVGRDETPSLAGWLFPLAGGEPSRYEDPAGAFTAFDGVMLGADVITTMGSNGGGQGLLAYDPVRGVHRLIEPMSPGPETTGAFHVGSDGKDLVWHRGEGGYVQEGVWARKSIMTAPYTTDPGKLRPRRLRSDTVGATVGSQFAVGCGHAARAHGDDLLIVRLADGVSWNIHGRSDWYPVEAEGLTCEEVFFTVSDHGVHNAARIRLDSLGPGQAPD